MVLIQNLLQLFHFSTNSELNVSVYGVYKVELIL